MKALIIGGAGYIGSHVARHFLDNGHQVTVFDNLSTGQLVNIFSEEDFIKGDILDPAELDAAMKGGYDLIIHCGACMFNRRYVLSRVQAARAANIPMTNYGVAIAALIGILDKVTIPKF